MRHPAPAAAHPAPHGRNRARGAGAPAACAGRHRQPGLHALDRALRAHGRSARSRSSTTSRPRSGPGGPGRARSMRRYVDHVLALLPFEPDVHRRLGGPPCSYVGHPLIEEVAQAAPERRAKRRAAAPIRRSCWCCRAAAAARSGGSPAIFGAGDRPRSASASARSRWWCRPCRICSPQVTAATAAWPVRPRIVIEQAEKQAAFRIARAALGQVRHRHA